MITINNYIHDIIQVSACPSLGNFADAITIGDAMALNDR